MLKFLLGKTKNLLMHVFNIYMQIIFQMQKLVGCAIFMPIARIFRGSL